MPRIKLYDKLFAHAHAMGSGNLVRKPEKFEWYRGDDYCDIAVFTDASLSDAAKCDSDIKIALLMESPICFPQAYLDIFKMLRGFDYVLTFDRQTHGRIQDANGHGNATPVLYFLGGCWIDNPAIYPKSKSISVIVSDKKSTEGHRLRHEIVGRLGGKADVYGRGYNPVDDKADALRDYRFTIVVENGCADYYFTEKLIDAYATGTVPIYCGCAAAAEIFGKDAIIPFTTIEQLEHIVNSLLINAEEEYSKRLVAITQAHEHTKRYYVTENELWRVLFKGLCDDKSDNI